MLPIRQGADIRFTKTSRLLAMVADRHADQTWDKPLHVSSSHSPKYAHRYLLTSAS
jgi:hypothetical protein